MSGRATEGILSKPANSSRLPVCPCSSCIVLRTCRCLTTGPDFTTVTEEGLHVGTQLLLLQYDVLLQYDRLRGRVPCVAAPAPMPAKPAAKKPAAAAPGPAMEPKKPAAKPAAAPGPSSCQARSQARSSCPRTSSCQACHQRPPPACFS